MDFQLTEEHLLIKQMVRDFAEKEIAPRAEEIDATDQFPADIFKRMGELGLLGIPFAEAYGGSGRRLSQPADRPGGDRPRLRYGCHHPGCPDLAVLRADLPVRHGGAEDRNTCRRW